LWLGYGGACGWGLWRPGECGVVGDLGVRLWGSDMSDRPSGGRAGGNAHAVGHGD